MNLFWMHEVYLCMRYIKGKLKCMLKVKILLKIDYEFIFYAWVYLCMRYIKEKLRCMCKVRPLK